MIEWLTEPWQLEFMQRAFIVALIAAVVCVVVGSFVVLRGMAFIGDALAHTILPGIVIAFFNGVNLLVGALVAAIRKETGLPTDDIVRFGADGLWSAIRDAVEALPWV